MIRKYRQKKKGSVLLAEERLVTGTIGGGGSKPFIHHSTSPLSPSVEVGPRLLAVWKDGKMCLPKEEGLVFVAEEEVRRKQRCKVPKGHSVCHKIREVGGIRFRFFSNSTTDSKSMHSWVHTNLWRPCTSIDADGWQWPATS